MNRPGAAEALKKREKAEKQALKEAERAEKKAAASAAKQSKRKRVNEVSISASYLPINFAHNLRRIVRKN